MKLWYKNPKYRRFMSHKQLKISKQRHKKNKTHKNRVNFRRNRERSHIFGNKIKFPIRLYLNDSKETECIFYLIKKASKIDTPKLDFSATKYIDIGSAIYIKAFVDFLKNQNRPYEIFCTKKNRKMQEILQHIGIIDYNLKITYNDIKCWTFKDWDKREKCNYAKVIYEDILPKVLNGKVASEKFSSITSDLQELLYNCSEHAYTENDDFTNFYLLGGEYENKFGKSNQFSFCILDYGQGFKKSLYINFIEKLKNLLSDNTSDSGILKYAVEGHFNADKYKSKGRGTGLPSVIQSIKEVKGAFYLYSDKGCYIIDHSGKEILRDRKNEIIGSIIEVSLPITEEGYLAK